MSRLSSLYRRGALAGAVLSLLGGAGLGDAAEPGESLAAFYPLRPGARWVYRDESGARREESLVAVERDGPAVRRIAATGEERTVRLDAERGLLLLGLRLADGTTIDYERPVAVLPSRLVAGEPHRSQARFALRRPSGEQNVGSYAVETRLAGRETVETPAGRFADCLRVRVEAVRMDYGGETVVEETTLWLARGIGPVRIERIVRRRDETGAVVGTESDTLVLERAEP